MKIFKKNQIIIYVIALVLMTVGYLNYTNRTKKLDSIETSVETKSENLNNTNSDEIGDAKLVSSNDIASNSSNDNENIIEENLDTSKRTEENIENGEKEEQKGGQPGSSGHRYLPDYGASGTAPVSASDCGMGEHSHGLAVH